MAEKKKMPAAEKSDKRAEIIVVRHFGDQDFVQLYKEIAPSDYRNDDIFKTLAFIIDISDLCIDFPVLSLWIGLIDSKILLVICSNWNCQILLTGRASTHRIEFS